MHIMLYLRWYIARSHILKKVQLSSSMNYGFVHFCINLGTSLMLKFFLNPYSTLRTNHFRHIIYSKQWEILNRNKNCSGALRIYGAHYKIFKKEFSHYSFLRSFSVILIRFNTYYNMHCKIKFRNYTYLLICSKFVGNIIPRSTYPLEIH